MIFANKCDVSMHGSVVGMSGFAFEVMLLNE